MSQPRKSRLLVFLVTLALFAGVFALGVTVGREGAMGGISLSSNGSTSADFEPFWRAWKILDEKFVSASTSAPVSDQDKVWGAIKGLAASYGDPYTTFFPPAENAIFSGDISGSFGGVGMEVGIQDNIITVIAPLKDSPADRAGIRSLDKVLAINGTSTEDMSVDEAVGLIRGKVGTKVTLSILHEDAVAPVDVSIVRDTIQIPTIDTEERQGVFVIHLYNFYEHSAEQFSNALTAFTKSGDDKLVIDLRGNPGGYLEAAVDIASNFLPAGDVVVTEDFGNGETNVHRSKGYGTVPENVQMVVLADGGSASAAEILAGALQEHDRAQLVGTQTFGKGSVQELVNLTSETALKVTVARWLTPNGRSISNGGLTPDVSVDMTQDDYLAGRDPQLSKAVQILNQG